MLYLNLRVPNVLYASEIVRFALVSMLEGSQKTEKTCCRNQNHDETKQFSTWRIMLPWKFNMFSTCSTGPNLGAPLVQMDHLAENKDRPKRGWNLAQQPHAPSLGSVTSRNPGQSCDNFAFMLKLCWNTWTILHLFVPASTGFGTGNPETAAPCQRVGLRILWALVVDAKPLVGSLPVSHSIPQCSKDVKIHHVGYVVCFIHIRTKHNPVFTPVVSVCVGAWQVQILCSFPDCLVCCCTGLPEIRQSNSVKTCTQNAPTWNWNK